MDQRHLPNPAALGSQIKTRGTLESLLFSGPTPKIKPDHVFQLPPIRHNTFNGEALSNYAMSREPSVSSSTTSNHSGYQFSRSNSPMSTAYMEHSNEHSSPVNPVAMQPAHIAFNAVSSPPEAKKPRQKRNDRKQFSRLSANTRGEKIRKDQGEAGRRYDQCHLLAVMEKLFLEINPELPQMAIQGKELKQGWTPLKSNNRSKDVDCDEFGQPLQPFGFNKENLLSSGVYVLRHSNTVIHEVIQERQALDTEAAAILQRGASPEEMRNYLLHIVQIEGSRRIDEAGTQRGSVKFCPPFYQRPKF